MKRSACSILVLLAVLLGTVSIGYPANASTLYPLGSWKRTASGGFGEGKANGSIMSIVEYHGSVYAGTMNSDGAGIWRKSGGNWQKVSAGVFSEDNSGVVRMAVYNDRLYAGTMDDKGCQVFRYDGSVWEDVLTMPGGPGRGFGKEKNLAVTALYVFDGSLYAGITNISVDGGGITTEGPEIWRFDDGTDTWTEDDGDVIADSNLGVTSMGTCGGQLYAGTVRFSTTMTIIDLTHIKVDFVDRGCDLWRRGAGGGWTRVATDGFGDQRNIAAISMQEFDGRLYIGTANLNASVTIEWTTMAVTDFTLLSNGLKVYSYAGTMSAPLWSGTTDDLAALSMTTVTDSGRNYLVVGSICGEGRGKLRLYDGSGWSRGADDGFGSAANTGVTALGVGTADDPDRVYAGTANGNGCEMWETVWPPVVTAVSPTVGPEGTVVTITGSHFGNSRGTSYVTFDGVRAAGYPGWSAGSIRAKVPAGAGTGPVRVFTDSGGSNSDRIFTVTRPDWYLAEGTSDWGFTTYVVIANPNDTAVTARVSYMTADGLKPRPDVPLPANSQTTINPLNDLGKADFSTRVECVERKTIAVDRTMIWTGSGAAGPEAHASVGVTSPAGTWYLPEGSSKWGFETWLLIQNPNDEDAECNVVFMTEGSGEIPVAVTVPANSRKTYNMADYIGAEDSSIKVSSQTPVIAERAMYRNNRREGHCSVGTTAPSRSYYLAEGTTDWGFTTYVLVQNPNAALNTVTITYMTPSGSVEQEPFAMQPNSRKTVNVNNALPGKDLSTFVSGSLPVVVERAMYWDNGTGEACHDSIGLSRPYPSFNFADGQSSDGWETWTLVQNPNDSDVQVRVTYLLDGGGVKSLEAAVPANSRQTFAMKDTFSGRAGIVVQSLTTGKDIMSERAMYFNNRGGGTSTIGGCSD